MRGSAGIVATLLVLAACDGSSVDPDSVAPPTTTATTTTISPPVASTTSSTPPSTTSAANRPPVVTLAGGSCHPSAEDSRVGARSCSVRLVAEASDPDGDDLQILWSGCGSGRDLVADCEITALGPRSARIEVRDGRGGVAAAVAQAVGINQAPYLFFGGGRSRIPRRPTPSTIS